MARRVLAEEIAAVVVGQPGVIWPGQLSSSVKRSGKATSDVIVLRDPNGALRRQPRRPCQARIAETTVEDEQLPPWWRAARA